MTKPKMKVKEITVSLSGVIPVAAYENLRPGFSMTVELPEKQSAYEAMIYCQEYLHQLMKEEANRSKAEAIEKMYSVIRFYERNNKKYPSVTSILGYDKNWYGISEEQLQQYASQGTILEALCQHFLETGHWIDPHEIDSIREDIIILERGSMHFKWEDGSHKAFMKQYRDKIEVEQFQMEVYNDEHNYAGTLDLIGYFDGKLSVMDFKRNTYDMKQLAAYASCLEGIEQLVVLPIGPTDNKCGYKKPVICETIELEFKAFLKARSKFRKQFGI